MKAPMPPKLAPSLLATAFASCGSAASRPVIAVDSAGVRVVVSDPSASDATCELGEEPLLVVGDRVDDPAHLFGRIVGAARLSDGSVAVVDPTVDESASSTRRANIFGPWGAWATAPASSRTLGSYGSAPSTRSGSATTGHGATTYLPPTAPGAVPSR